MGEPGGFDRLRGMGGPAPEQGPESGASVDADSRLGVLLVCSHVIIHFQDAGVRMLFWLVPAWAALRWCTTSISGSFSWPLW